MRLLRRLPVYAAGVGFTVAVAAVSAARHWSDALTLLVALAVAAFYVVAIVVPWLISEQVSPGRVTKRHSRESPEHSGDILILDVSAVPAIPMIANHMGGVLMMVVSNGDETEELVPMTEGEAVLTPQPQFTAR